MKTIFVISPSYLGAVYSESKKYSIAMQGYGTFEKASNGILYVNACDILGFAYVADALPDKGTKEYNDMLTFLKKCNSLTDNKKFVIAVSEGATFSKRFVETLPNLRFYVAQDTQFISDVVINKNVFGSLLLDTYKPYIVDKPKEVQVQKFNIPVMQAKQLISSYITRCCAPINFQDSIESTLACDEIFVEYSKLNNPLQFVRKLAVYLKFDKEIAQIVNDFWSSINNVSDTRLRCVYISLFQSALGGKLL